MIEVLLESVRLVNLPFTLLLGIVVIYWLLVTVGLLDFDFHADAGGDFQADGGGADAHLPETDVHHSAELAHSTVEGTTDHEAASHKAAHGSVGVGWFAHLLQFVNIGEVPVMIVLSVLALSLWISSMTVNHYLNNHSVLRALLFLGPILVISAVITRYATMPLKRIFALLNREQDEYKSLIGQSCIVTTSEITRDFGQAQIETRGAPLLINVRAAEEEPLRKGETALVVREDKQKNVYYVVKVTADKLEA
jgi:hypothetical protein